MMKINGASEGIGGWMMAAAAGYMRECAWNIHSPKWADVCKKAFQRRQRRTLTRQDKAADGTQEGREVKLEDT